MVNTPTGRILARHGPRTAPRWPHPHLQWWEARAVGARDVSLQRGETTVLSGRNRRIFLLFIVVLNIVVTVLSVQRGDMAMAILFAAAAVLILFQLIRPFVGGKDDDRDDRTPPSS